MLAYKSGNFDGSFNITNQRSHFILGVMRKKLNKQVMPKGRNVLFVLAGKTDSVSMQSFDMVIGLGVTPNLVS